MALPTSKLQQGLVTTEGTSIGNLHCTGNKFVKSSKHSKLHRASRIVDIGQLSDGHQLKLKSPKQAFWYICSKPKTLVLPRGLSVLCQSTGTQNTETRECSGNKAGCSDSSRTHGFHEDNEPIAVPGIANFVSNDAKYVNERARNDIVLLSRGIMRLDERARQDVAIIGSGFLKLDARARKDTRKIDRSVKKKAERLHHIASMLKDIAESRLKKAADKHWSDGALEADLRRADFFAKQRAARDAFMALEFIKNIHDMMVTEMYKLKTETLSVDGLVENIMIEKNGKTLDFFPGEMSTDRISAVQEVYWSMASALSEADGIDYTDPEELELLVATLIDLDAMDGKSSVSLLVECSSSPDDNTRKALANALAAAPSMWTLGNAGMGALQRLAEDSNPAIAAAASKTIYELKKQWEIEEGDIWRFTTNQTLDEDGDSDEDCDAAQ